MNNSGELIAAYGGTFDPCTLGHSQIIKKACSVFDKLHIVVATNVNKTPSFPIEDRVEMLRDTIQYIAGVQENNVVIQTLPDTTYLVDFAKEIGAKFLVRGIRDSMDFHYENQIYHTNKIIQPSVETLYLMPDEALSLVSSSWVKGLVGQRGWRKVVEQYVSPLTLDYLVTQYAEKRFMKLVNGEMGFNVPPSPNVREEMWLRIKGMNSNAYHNINHILNCLETFDSMATIDKRFEVEMAFWLHDVFATVDDCMSYAHIRLLRCDEKSRELVKTLIASTKHETCEYKTELEERFSSIDLLVLASDVDGYDNYVKRVKEEYLKNSGLTKNEFEGKWLQGRSDFLTKMLARKKIFAWEPFYEMYEAKARGNMGHELHILLQQIELNKEYVRLNG